MTPDEYVQLANRTVNADLPPSLQAANVGLGLAGEAGEVADLLKKHLCHGHELDRDRLVDELGDVCWYIARACNLFDLSLEQVLVGNIQKLADRYPQGFSQRRSRLHVIPEPDSRQTAQQARYCLACDAWLPVETFYPNPHGRDEALSDSCQRHEQRQCQFCNFTDVTSQFPDERCPREDCRSDDLHTLSPILTFRQTP